MPQPFPTDADPDRDSQMFAAHEDDDLRALMKPVMAGARARGVADGLEMLGVGAVLIDATGRVLHVGGRGRRLMGGCMQIAESHLVAEHSADNRALQDLVSEAIAGTPTPEGVRIGAAGGATALNLRAIRFKSDEGMAQRLHAVLIIDAVAASGPASAGHGEGA